MNSAQRVPNEVLIQIFQQVPRKTAYECIYVCNAWSFAATQEYYKELYLNGEMITLLQHALDPSPRVQQQSSIMITHTEHVRSLIIHKDIKQTERFSKDQLLSLLSRLPYLRKIDFTSSRRLVYYLDNLSKIFKGGKKSNRDPILKKVEEVVIHFNEEYYSKAPLYQRFHYLSICYALRATLTHLILNRIDGSFAIGKSWNNNYMDYLAQFQNLTHLNISNKKISSYSSSNYYDARAGIKDISMKSLLNACSPNLINLKLNSDHPISHVIDGTTNEFDVILLASSEASARSSAILNKHQAQTELHENKQCLTKSKILSLCAPDITVKNMCDYICLPNISTLELEINHVYDVWVQEHDTEDSPAAIHFLQQLTTNNQLRSIKDFSLSVQHDHPYGQGNSDSRLTMLKTKLNQIPLQKRIDTFQAFVDGIGRSHGGLLCSMILDIHNEKVDKFNDFSLSIKNGIMNVKYGFRSRNDMDALVLPSFLGGSGADMRLLPSLYSIEINLKAHHPHGNLSHLCGEVCSFINEILESLLANCPRLTNILVRSGEAHYDRGYYCRLRSNLSNSIQNNNNGDASTSDISRRYKEFKDSTTLSASDRMTHATFCRLDVTQKLIDGLINNSLQHIRSLDLEKCSFPDAASDRNVTLDFSKISHLELFKLDLWDLEFLQFNHAFFIIEYINSHDGETTVYYDLDKKKRSQENMGLLKPTTFEYIHGYNRFSSTKSVAYTIKFSRISTIGIYSSDKNNCLQRADIQLN